MKSSMALCIVSGFLINECRAANQYFMPGDAFFHTVLTSDLLDEIDESKNPVLPYARPESAPRMFCGWVGFRELQCNQMDDSLKRNLRLVYTDLRKSTPKRVEITQETRLRQTDEGDIEVPTGRELRTEINGMSVLIYNRSFNMTQFRFGLKYNENWADDYAAFGLPRDDAQYEPFVSVPDAIALDWRDGTLVPPLAAKLPPLTTKASKTPLEMDSEIMAVVMPQPNFDSLYRGVPYVWGGFSAYLVTAEGVTRLEAKEGRWQPVDQSR